ncbi:MAG: hypothetical protein WBI14_03160 [Anaerolineaceae bacterium]
MDSFSPRIHSLAFFSLLLILVLAACSGVSEATKTSDLLRSVAIDPTADSFIPKVVLTIAPTQRPLPTATQIPPTSTQEFIPTHTVTRPVETPTEITSPTTMLQSNEPTVGQGNLSACPQGCSEPPPGCLIKGNINSDGVKIYHIPGQNYYEQTKISSEKGERWFCTPTEAEANGWRAAKH